MGRRSIVFITILGLAAILGVAAYYNEDGGVESTSKRDAGSVQGADDSRKSVRERKLGRKGEDFNKFLAYSKLSSSTTRESERDSQLQSGYGDRELEDDKDRNRKIAPIIWDKTQSVLENLMEEEYEDEKWKSRIEEFAEYLLDEEKYEGTSLDYVDCRTTLCKAVLSHDGRGSQEIFKSEGSTTGLWMQGDMFGATSEKENGGIESTIYFTRRGEYYPFEEVSNRLLAMVESEL
jgi:hypothetical protein